MTDIEEIMKSVPRKYEQGIQDTEMRQMIKALNEKTYVNMDRFNDAMIGHTCPVIDGQTLWYDMDVYKGLKYAIKESNTHFWD